MRSFERVLAIALALGGVRSFIVWVRRPFLADADTTDVVLYAINVTSRVGSWFAFAGFFFLYSTFSTDPALFRAEASKYSWYVMVPIVLSALQFVSGQFLGRRVPVIASDEAATPAVPHAPEPVPDDGREVEGS
jgi:hypothetical protein